MLREFLESVPCSKPHKKFKTRPEMEGLIIIDDEPPPEAEAQAGVTLSETERRLLIPLTRDATVNENFFQGNAAH